LHGIYFDWVTFDELAEDFLRDYRINQKKSLVKRKGFFEHDEYLTLKDALPYYLKPIVTFGYNFGWRLGEIFTLTWDKVDLTNGVVRIETGETKNDEARTVYLDKLKKVFQKLFSESRLDIANVFLRDGEPIKGFRKAWLKACKEAGLKGKLFHDLRRTAVRNMVRAGIPEGVAMKISGHKTRSVFDRYNIVSDRDLRLATQKQEVYFSEQEKRFAGNKPNTEKLVQFLFFVAPLKKAAGTVLGTIGNSNEKRVNRHTG